jgi:hypothetical protein
MPRRQFGNAAESYSLDYTFYMDLEQVSISGADNCVVIPRYVAESIHYKYYCVAYRATKHTQIVRALQKTRFPKKLTTQRALEIRKFDVILLA